MAAEEKCTLCGFIVCSVQLVAGALLLRPVTPFTSVAFPGGSTTRLFLTPAPPDVSQQRCSQHGRSQVFKKT